MNPSESGNKNGSFLEVRNVTKKFGSFLALDNVSLGVCKGEFVCILGPSGCGKTTLLRVIAGLEDQNNGSIFLGGRDISHLPTSKRKCGIVFQSYALFPNLTVKQNVAYGIHRRSNSKTEIKNRVKELLELVGLSDIGNKYPAQMSGGQQQRVALARALAPSPSILLLDEPLSALDARVRVRLRQELRHLQERLGITTIMVTHDQEEALTMADRVAVMNNARLIQFDLPQDIYRLPQDAFVAGFIGFMNFMEGWTIWDKYTASNGDISLNIRLDNIDQYVGKEVTLAIRPEDVRVLSEKTDQQNILKTEVEEYEFRGSFYRLRLKPKTDDLSANIPYLDVDLQSDHIERLGIMENSILYIQFPSDRLLIFQQSTT
jgi:iron(III) transport system ATP-binding protein